MDPENRGLGQFFQEEIAGPLGLEFYIGLPREIPDSRLAIVEDTRPRDFFLHLNEVPLRFTLAFVRPKTTTWRTMSNPPSLRGQITNFNRRDVLVIEMPSANGIGQVREPRQTLQRVRHRRLHPRAQAGDARRAGRAPRLPHLRPAGPRPSGQNGLLARLQETSPAFRFGTNGKSYGVGGIGGSLAFADPEAQVSFAYAMTRPGFLIFDDPRAKALRDALSRCISDF